MREPGQTARARTRPVLERASAGSLAIAGRRLGSNGSQAPSGPRATGSGRAVSRSRLESLGPEPASHLLPGWQRANRSVTVKAVDPEVRTGSS